MGYNALPTLPNADPQVEDDIHLELWLGSQLSSLTTARDAALTPYVRVVVPFHGFAALEMDAVPVELWRVSPETQAKLGATRPSGTALGDVRFGARFTLVDERRLTPAFGVLFTTKTASGKAFQDRRFTDAPGYMVDGLLGKTLPFGLGPFEHARLLAKLGFVAWQQGSGWQDDAVALGATLKLATRAGSRLEVEWRAYQGYERHDRPALLGVTLGRPVTRAFDLAATLNRGVNADAPPWEVRLGVVLRFEHSAARPE